MTAKGLKTKFVGAGALGLLGIAMAALGAESDAFRETFTQTAERWGLWAALSVAMTASAVAGLVFLVRFTISTMAGIIDDNTFAFLHFTNALSKRKCLHDSDMVVADKELEEDGGPLGVTGRRVLQRRKERQEKRG